MQRVPNLKQLRKNSSKTKSKNTKEKINSVLIKKSKIKSSSIYNNPSSQPTNYNLYNNVKNKKNSIYNKIKVNRIFSPTFSKKKNESNYSNNNYNNTQNYSKNKIIEKKIQNLQNSISSVSLISFENLNAVKLININIDENKLKIIQHWWKYIYKIIFIQKNIRAFLAIKEIKKKFKCYNFISCMIKIYFTYFNKCIKYCYMRNFLKKWNEVTYKKMIINRLLYCSKTSKNRKQIFSVNSSIYSGIDKTVRNNSKNILNNSSNKIYFPFNGNTNMKVNTPTNFQINIKKRKRKNVACNIYNNENKNIFNKSLTNKSKINLRDNNFKSYISNNNSKYKERLSSYNGNRSLHNNRKNKIIANYLYQNIKEYYNINEITINPTISSSNFYSNKFNKTNNNNKSKKLSKIPIKNTLKKSMTNFNKSFKSNDLEKNFYVNTLGNIKTTKNKNKKSKIFQSKIISPSTYSNRNKRRHNSKSLEFNNNDIHKVLLLVKVKKYFIYWRNLIINKKIINKLRLISKIKHIYYIFKIIYIKLFFAKIFYKLYNNSFCLNVIDYNCKYLDCYYKNLKKISNIKKINYLNKNNFKNQKKENYFKRKNIEKKNSKYNNKNIKLEELYYATHTSQKFNNLLNNKKKSKKNNIIIINNNINNNCHQLIKRPNKNKTINKRCYNNSMIEIQTMTDSTISTGNPNEKSFSKVLSNNIIYNKKNKLENNKKNKNEKSICLYSLINLIEKIKIKKELKKYIDIWKSQVKNKNKNSIDEKIIHFPKSPSINHSINYYGNKNNFNFINNNINKGINNICYNYYKNNDLLINTVFTDNNKNPKNLYGSTFLRDSALTPCNKFIFFTENNNDSYNNSNTHSRKSNSKIIYQKKVLPLSSVKNSDKSNFMIFDYNYNKNGKYRNNNIVLDNNQMNNYNFGGNIITNYYTSNNFFNKKNYYSNLDDAKTVKDINYILPEEKYGFKKADKIEEREINFSPTISKRNNLKKNISSYSIDKNISNKNIFIDTINGNKSKNNYKNNFPTNHTVVEEYNYKKLMNHSQSQNFKKSI